jgi:hypothetical protein
MREFIAGRLVQAVVTVFVISVVVFVFYLLRPPLAPERLTESSGGPLLYSRDLAAPRLNSSSTSAPWSRQAAA